MPNNETGNEKIRSPQTMSVRQFVRHNGYEIVRGFVFSLLPTFALCGPASADDIIRVPENAIQVECRQEFKDLQTSFYQYILISIDKDLGEGLGINLVDPFTSWSGSALVYLKNESGIRRIVNKVDFFQDGQGGYISGLEGYRYGSFGVLGNNGIFVEYETREDLGDAIFDSVQGCYILR